MPLLKKKNILITAGSTRGYLDAVRYITAQTLQPLAKTCDAQVRFTSAYLYMLISSAYSFGLKCVLGDALWLHLN